MHDEEIEPADVGGFCDASEHPAEETREDGDDPETEAVERALRAAGSGEDFEPRTDVERMAAAFIRLLRWLSVPSGRRPVADHAAAIAARVEIALFLIVPEASEHDSLASIARRFGLSRERCRQLAAAAFPKPVDAGGAA